jgi:hypothetical protein
MGCSGENVLCQTARHSVPGIERLWHGAAPHPMKSLHAPIPRHQCWSDDGFWLGLHQPSLLVDRKVLKHGWHVKTVSLLGSNF